MVRGALIIGLGVGGWMLASGEALANHPLFEQKSRLLDRFLVQSATSEQVGLRGDAKLKEILDQTRRLREEARRLHDQGEIEKATAQVDLAIKEAVKLSQLTSGPAKQAWNQRMRFEGLQAGVITFEEAYVRNLQTLSAEGGGAGAKPPPQPVKPEEIRQVLAKAAALAGKEEYAQANELLADMQQKLTSALKAMLDSKTLVYQLKFETPQHEYRYELDRMLSFEALLNMALSKAAIDENGRRIIRERQEKSRALHREAEKQAAAGDFKEAIRTMENANEQLSQAMMMAGIVFP